MSGEAIINDVDPEIHDVHACKNLHAAEKTLCPLSGEVQRLIERLSAERAPAALYSSISLNLSDLHASRGPFRAKRQAWHRKSSYQRRRCHKRLRPWQVDALFEADAFARNLDLPLNTFVTVSWINTRHGGTDIPRRFGRATKAMGEWLRRRSIEPSWVFVHEIPAAIGPTHTC